MAMASSSLLSLRLPKPNAHFNVRASSSSSPPSTSSPPQTQTLEERFGRKGIKFVESDRGVPSVELSVRNGSSLHLRIPDGLVTSYKPKVHWKDDGFEEVLHTITTPPSGSSDAAVKGGLGLVLNDVSDSLASIPRWSASEWSIKDADSDSFDAVQVELSCNNGDGSLEITYIVSLYPLSMATALVVRNKGRKTVKLTSAILSHIKFKSRIGSAIEGLRGCSYCSHPPLSSSFGLLSPAQAMEPEPPSWLSSLGFSSGKEVEKDAWTVEDDMYTVLKGKLSRVYTAPPSERVKRIYSTPPSRYSTIDQGSGLGFRVIRMGYDDIYLSSPGSLSQKYGNDYFICTGPASMLVPVILNEGEEWRGAQVIEHDNL